MPNQYSKDSRRVTYVEDVAVFEHLARIAAHQGVTVGELIRRATAEKYNFSDGDLSLDASEETSVSARFRRSEPAPKAAKAAKAKKSPRKPRNKKYGG